MIPCGTIMVSLRGGSCFRPGGVLGSSSKDVADLILKVSVFALPEKRNQNSMFVMFELWFLVPWLSMGYSWITMVNHGIKKNKAFSSEIHISFFVDVWALWNVEGYRFFVQNAHPFQNSLSGLRKVSFWYRFLRSRGAEFF